MHAHTYMYIYIIYRHTEQRACGIYRAWASSTECVGHVSVDLEWSSSVVEWMCSSVQRNSTAAALKTKKPITHQTPDHSMSYSLCTHLQCTYSTTWTDAHTRLMCSPPSYTNYTHTHTLPSFHCTHPLSPAIDLPLS